MCYCCLSLNKSSQRITCVAIIYLYLVFGGELHLSLYSQASEGHLYPDQHKPGGKTIVNPSKHPDPPGNKHEQRVAAIGFLHGKVAHFPSTGSMPIR